MDRQSIVLTAGFGDSSEMYGSLFETPLASKYRLIPIDLPGFGGAPPLAGDTTLASLAEFVADRAKQEGARTIIAHSASSIIASLAADGFGRPIDTILSLEGNITAEDAYFSGSAANYTDPSEFKDAFIKRLGEMSETQPIVARYLRSVSCADARALWELGCDVRRFSARISPGEILSRSAEVFYLYNPSNCPEATLVWLRTSSIHLIRADSASHWISVDQPEELSRLALAALERSRAV